MKKAVFLLAWVTMGVCCLIAWNATRDTQLKNVAVEQRTEEAVIDAATKEETLPQGNLIDQNNRYAFGYLSQEEQSTYLDIVSALLSLEKETKLHTTDAALVDKVFNCVMLDYPEIFYVDGYQYTLTQTGDEKELTFCGNYLYQPQEIADRRNKIEAYTEGVLSEIGEEDSAYEVVKYIYEKIINETEYTLNSVDNQNICSVLITHSSVCQGYAKAAQYLLNRLGMECALVVGTVKNGEGHAWNLVKIDKEFYYMDVTWGDAYYLLSENGDLPNRTKNPSVNYDYLNVTTNQLLLTHTIESIVPMPECTSMNANYYVREGAYFEQYEEDKLRTLFQRALEENRETVTVKCSSEVVYGEIMRELIENQKVFTFFEEVKETVAYTNCEEQRSISFWM